MDNIRWFSTAITSNECVSVNRCVLLNKRKSCRKEEVLLFAVRACVHECVRMRALAFLEGDDALAQSHSYTVVMTV